MKSLTLQIMLKFYSEKGRFWLLFSFLFLLAFGSRKIFNFSAVENITSFRENQTFSLYLFDLPILFTLIAEFFIFWKKSSSFKNFSSKIHTFSFLEKIVLLFLVWISIVLIFKFSLISFYAFIRLAEAIFLFFWTQKIFLLKKEIFLTGTIILFLSGILQTFIAFWQFIWQKSIGLFWLGESHISPQILGVAKIELENQKLIRAYGTFPHSNLLATFLFFTLVSGIYLFFNSSKNRQLYFLGSLWILLGIFLSFSRSSWLITFLFLTIIFFKKNYLLYENSSNFFSSSFQKIFSWKFCLLFLFILFFILNPLTKNRLCLDCQNDRSFSLRKIYTQNAQENIKENFLFGLGLGNFSLNLSKNNPRELHSWEIQPVHNLYLLAGSEVGFLGIIFFGIIFYELFFKKNNFQNLFLWSFGSFLLLGFFDHYFWTLPQGQLLFFLALAFFAYSCKIEKLRSILRKEFLR